MQSEDLHRLLKSLQEQQQGQDPPAPVPSTHPPPQSQLPGSIDDLLRGLRHASAGSSAAATGTSSSQRPISPVPPAPVAFETFNHAHQIDPLDEANQDGDDEDDYQMYEAMSKPDLRFCSYAESLTILGDLCQTPAFVNALKALRKAQEEWEIRQLHQRNRILLGIRKSTHTARDLKTHDLETLAMYDELRTKQQKRLEELGAPVISATQDANALKRQKRIIQTLELALEDIEAKDNKR